MMLFQLLNAISNTISFLSMKSKIKSDSEEKLIDKNENIPEQVAKENILNKSHK